MWHHEDAKNADAWISADKAAGGGGGNGSTCLFVECLKSGAHLIIELCDCFSLR